MPFHSRCSNNIKGHIQGLHEQGQHEEMLPLQFSYYKLEALESRSKPKWAKTIKHLSSQ